MKKRRNLLIGFFIAVFTVVGIFSVVNNGSNKIFVTCDKNLSIEKVRIEFGFNSINRKNDLELFENSKSHTVLVDGDSETSFKTDFGENDFLIIYDNSYYFSFRHFIETDFVSDYPTAHKYFFDFYMKNNRPAVKVSIEGEQKMNFERELIEKEFAKKYCCNVPIDSTKFIYNMVELEGSKK